MKWYVAELIVECRVGHEPADLWDTQLVLVRERDAEAAYASAKRLGREQNQTYRNSVGETVRWRFKGLGDLDGLLINALRSGVEVHSRLSRASAPAVCPKSRLTVFWIEKNKHRTIQDLLQD